MRTLEADVCIIGSGFAGTFIAHKLKNTSLRILILEKGPYLEWDHLEENYLARDPIYDDPAFEKYDFTNVGPDDFNYSGHHAVGGCSLVWFGNCVRKVPADFRTKSTYGIGEDWPLSYDDLEPHYFEAEKEMLVSGPRKDDFTRYRKDPFPMPPFEVPPAAIEINRRMEGSGFVMSPGHKARLPVDHGKKNACCGAGTCQVYCPIDARYTCLTSQLADLRKLDNVTIADGITVTRLHQRGDRVVEVEARDAEGGEVRCKAHHFILAANAVENARIILLSRADAARTGFSMKSDAVGRYLADQVGIWLPISFPVNIHPFYEQTVQSTHSLSFYDGPFRSERSGILVEVWFSNFIRRLGTTSVARSTILNAVSRGLFGKEIKEAVNREYLGRAAFCLEMEMLPDPENRVTLDPKGRDRFGDAAARFHFSIWSQEYLRRSVEHYYRFFFEAIGDAGGYVDGYKLRGSFDHMLGTCRMGTDPRRSVVDPDLKSHEHSNLYIVGGSAFPSSGLTNPTLTIVALTLRCGDHLRAKLGS